MITIHVSPAIWGGKGSQAQCFPNNHEESRVLSRCSMPRCEGRKPRVHTLTAVEPWVNNISLSNLEV